MTPPPPSRLPRKKKQNKIRLDHSGEEQDDGESVLGDSDGEKDDDDWGTQKRKRIVGPCQSGGGGCEDSGF